jgi:GNAT superfamily N-acetyltransferase
VNQNHSITIRPITSQDESYFKNALELLNRTQGRDLFAPNYMELRTKDPQAFIAGAFQGKELVGLGVAQVINNYDFYLPFDPDINKKLSLKKVGSFSTLCVLESLQGKGIGKRISEARLEWVKKQNCDVIVGVSWVSGLEHTSNRVFEKMGFTAVKKVDHFFGPMSVANPFDCPGCHKIPCTCAGILYMRKV